MRHTWKWVHACDHQRCRRCGIERRMTKRSVDKDTNPARTFYIVWEYRPQYSSSWRWVKSRDGVPACTGKGPGDYR